MAAPHSSIVQAFTQARTALDALVAAPGLLDSIDASAGLVTDTLRAGRKVMVCGNGGSMCDAAHFAEELTGRYRKDRRPLAAIACTEPGHITCTANDYGFEAVFSRWVEALGQEADCLVVLSTSGNSKNCIRAVEAARARKMPTIALLGFTGGALKSMANHAIVVPGATTDRIQELHMLILHAWVEAVEIGLFGGS